MHLDNLKKLNEKIFDLTEENKILNSKLEEYEKCAELLKYKQVKNRSKKITAKGMTRKDLSDLRLLGFQIPDIITLKVLATSGSVNDSRAGN